jgi:hypothetical protein
MFGITFLMKMYKLHRQQHFTTFRHPSGNNSGIQEFKLAYLHKDVRKGNMKGQIRPSQVRKGQETAGMARRGHVMSRTGRKKVRKGQERSGRSGKVKK